jgi:hypothetical protein
LLKAARDETLHGHRIIDGIPASAEEAVIVETIRRKSAGDAKDL